MVCYIILMFFLITLPCKLQAASINPAIDQVNVIKLDGSIELKWKFVYDTNSEDFIGLQCGKTVNADEKSSGSQIKVIIANLNQDLSVTTQQPAFAKVSATITNNVISIKMEKLEAGSTGDYTCQMKFMDNIQSILKTISSGPIRLTTTDTAAAAASVKAEKSKKQMIIIGVVVGTVGLVLFLVVVACFLQRRRRKQTPHQVKSAKQTNDKKNKKKKKLTKQDIQQSSRRFTERDNRDEDPKYAEVEIVSTPEDALKRPDYEGESMREYV